MEKSRKIMRRSIFTFLKNYDIFTSKAALLALPFSASILMSQALLLHSSSSSSTIHIQTRLAALFDAAGFPKSSHLLQILIRKLSQTISSSILTLPSTLSFLLVSKSVVIRSLHAPKPASKTSLLSVYAPILLTYAHNSLLVLSANATVFALLFFAFTALQLLGFDSPNALLLLSAALYSVVLANFLVVCNLALALSGLERLGGYMATLKACVLIKGRALTALSLALPMNLGLASVEALFQFRVVRAYHVNGKLGCSMVLEGLLIFYLYSILLVIDTIVSVMLYKSCQERRRVIETEGVRETEVYEANNGDQQEIQNCGYVSLKYLEELA